MGWNIGKLIFDTLKNFLVTIDGAHAEIHKGDSYFKCLTTSDLKNNPLSFSFTTGNKFLHMIISLASTNDGIYILEENAVFSGGTPISEHNRHRGSTNTSTITLLKSGSTFISGDNLCNKNWGSKTKGGEARGISEWVLDKNTTYFIGLTGTTSSPAELNIDWYE